MTTAGSEQIIAVDTRVGAISERVVERGRAHGYSVVAAGPGIYRLARSTRPLWARVAAIVTFPFLGLGLLFLVVRRDEDATIAVFEDRAGAKLRIVGHLDAALVDDLRTAPPAEGPGEGRAPDAASASPEPPGPQKTPPPPAPSSLPSAFPPGSDPARQPIAAEPAENERAAAAFGETVVRSKATEDGDELELVLPDGSRHDCQPGVVVGRAPAATGVASGMVPMPIGDPSVSKTHASIERTGASLMVTDLHSTNGTFLVSHGRAVDCQPGVPVKVPPGAEIHLGDVVLRAEARS